MSCHLRSMLIRDPNAFLITSGCMQVITGPGLDPVVRISRVLGLREARMRWWHSWVAPRVAVSAARTNFSLLQALRLCSAASMGPQSCTPTSTG